MTRTIGARIRHERERIGIGQDAVATAASITVRSQRNYETGTRVPDVNYLVALHGLGFDIDYILFDIKEGEVNCPFLLSQELPAIISTAECRQNASGTAKTVSPRRMRYWRACQQCPKNPIKSNQQSQQGLAGDIDSALLMEIIEILEAALNAVDVRLPPHKKARIVVMLYRAFKLSGKVDQKMIADAVGIAE